MSDFAASPSGMYDVAIVGGGIVGAASALALSEAAPDLKIVLLEKEKELAMHQTGHNSGVIHAGLYRPGSLKAKTCVEGRELLYRFCEEREIPHERCGKVVVATREEELPRLRDLESRAEKNGLEGVRILSAEALREIEPHAAGIAALWVPQTGIVDFARVTREIAALFCRRGGTVRKGAPVSSVLRDAEGFRLRCATEEVRSRWLVNCAGLFCDRVARLCGVHPGLRIIPFRGEYYSLVPGRRSLVRNLIYPVPDPALPFLGVHFTRMIDGTVEAGPNAVLALKREGYDRTSFSLRDTLETIRFPGFWRLVRGYLGTGVAEYYRSWNKAAFHRELQRLLPALKSNDLQRGGAGVRAQAVGGDGKLIDDFRILAAEGMIHVLNAPSPAATASLSIGRQIAGEALGHWMGS